MSTVVPVSIPRWQWRVFGADLSTLARRLHGARTGAISWSEETHLVCGHSAHHAWFHGDALELRWRKEVDADGFELWDPILQSTAPFTHEAVGRLFAAWGIPAPLAGVGDRLGRPALERLLAATDAVRPVRVGRSCQAIVRHGVSCCLESVTVGDHAAVQSFSAEHEDPSVLRHLLGDIGLSARDNTCFLQGLKAVLAEADQQPSRRHCAG